MRSPSWCAVFGVWTFDAGDLMRAIDDQHAAAGWYLDPQSGAIRRVVGYVVTARDTRHHRTGAGSAQRYQLYDRDPTTPPDAPPPDASLVAVATLGVQFFRTRREAAAAVLVICDRTLAVARLAEQQARERLWAAHDRVAEVEALQRRLRRALEQETA